MKTVLMNIEGYEYKLVRNNSIFSDRNNRDIKKEDCTISIKNNKNNQNPLIKVNNDWRVLVILKAEDGSLLRKMDEFPRDHNQKITKSKLKSWGVLKSSNSPTP